MLKAIHASEDIAAAREKAVRAIEKLRDLRLSRAAELVEAAAEETLTYYASRRSTGGVSAPTTRSSAYCARSGVVPASSGRFRTGNPRHLGTSMPSRGRPPITTQATSRRVGWIKVVAGQEEAKFR